jgi:hypothetical protein
LSFALRSGMVAAERVGIAAMIALVAVGLASTTFL